MWRVWFHSLNGKEEYVDVLASYDGEAIRRACHLREADGRMTHWWVDRWQPLQVWAGNAAPTRWFRCRGVLRSFFA